MKRLAAALLFLLAAPAFAAVGFTLSPAATVCSEDSNSGGRECYPINRSARPFGADGNTVSIVPGEQLRLMGERYRGGRDYSKSRQAIGFEADIFEQNGGTLRAWFAEQPETHRALWDGVPTFEEKYDLAHSEDRRSSAFYDRYWWAGFATIVVDESNFVSFRGLLKGEGITTLGIHKIKNALGITLLYDVRWLPEQESPVEPPTTPPKPVTCPPPPTCAAEQEELERLSVALESATAEVARLRRRLRARPAAGDLEAINGALRACVEEGDAAPRLALARAKHKRCFAAMAKMLRGTAKVVRSPVPIKPPPSGPGEPSTGRLDPAVRP